MVRYLPDSENLRIVSASFGKNMEHYAYDQLCNSWQEAMDRLWDIHLEKFDAIIAEREKLAILEYEGEGHGVTRYDGGY